MECESGTPELEFGSPKAQPQGYWHRQKYLGTLKNYVLVIYKKPLLKQCFPFDRNEILVSSVKKKVNKMFLLKC